MSDQYLVRHCAPTLAGLKTGSLFTCPYGCREELFCSIRRMNQRLLPKGLRVLPLRCSEHKALIYIYRPKKLTRDLTDPAAAEILQQHGYDNKTCERSIGNFDSLANAVKYFHFLLACTDFVDTAEYPAYLLRAQGGSFHFLVILIFIDY